MQDTDRDRMIRDLHRVLLEAPAGGQPLIERLEGLCEALLEVPVGADKETRPLLSRINAVVMLHERASWTLRAAVYLISAAGVIAGGIMAIREAWR